MANISQTPIIKDFEKFSDSYLNSIQSPSSKLIEAIKYSLLNGGKRIRAQFVYIIGEMFKVNYFECHKLAFAIESIHAYSLIHDDLPAMDNDSLRRGKPTSHIKFGEATAILAGDALQTLAFEVLQSLETSDIKNFKKINKYLASCSGIQGMVSGQQLDIEGENKPLALNELNTIHTNKTAKMFCASFILPFLLSSKKNDADIEIILSSLAISIGLCFQIKDDILDVTENSKTLGKTANKDASSQKSTYVSILGLNGAKEALIKELESINKYTSILKKLGFNCLNLEKLIKIVIDRNY